MSITPKFASEVLFFFAVLFYINIVSLRKIKKPKTLAICLRISGSKKIGLYIKLQVLFSKLFKRNNKRNNYP